MTTPDFDADSHDVRPCTPFELYRSLRHPGDHVHYIEPGFHFAVHAVSSPERCEDVAVDLPSSDFVHGHVEAAQRDLVTLDPVSRATSWLPRVVKEFAPAGLIDGAWLQGCIRVAHVENEIGMEALAQLLIRFSDPGTGESYSQRYRALLRSVGVPADDPTRVGIAETAPCCDISYEHALLGLTLGLFPGALKPETIGFNLWMASCGPCPLLERHVEELRTRGACVSYFDGHDRQAMTRHAVEMVRHALDRADDVAQRERISRGFFAAHRSYMRWQRAMLGANIPVTPFDCVVDIVRRKARFALGHHTSVTVGDRPLETYFAGDADAHVNLVRQLETSAWVRAGRPDLSPLVTDLLSIDGPMFDIFTASEQQDLREWIDGIGASQARSAAATSSTVRPDGLYTPAQRPDSLYRYAVRRFGGMNENELMYHVVNADQYPGAVVFARLYAERSVAALSEVLQNEPRLKAAEAPEYSDEVVTHMVASNHERNVATQQRPAAMQQMPNIANVMDGSWLQGFADAALIHCEEYGRLFRIYASEMGDGHLAWNHNHIARHMLRDRAPAAMFEASDRRLYDLSVGVYPLIRVCMAVNTAAFLPELLGLNLAIEAGSVCGDYISQWKYHERQGDRWSALYARLHNSIDNYATGHTMWSVGAVIAFMERVRQVSPGAVQTLWGRIWRQWRWLEIQTHGTPEERRLFGDALAPKNHAFIMGQIAAAQPAENTPCEAIAPS